MCELDTVFVVISPRWMYVHTNDESYYPFSDSQVIGYHNLIFSLFYALASLDEQHFNHLHPINVPGIFITKQKKYINLLSLSPWHV